MKKCLALRHVQFEDLGLFAKPLPQRGYYVRYVDVPTEIIGLGEAINADVLVILGSSVGVHDLADYPWLENELQAIGGRLASSRPTLGICLAPS